VGNMAEKKELERRTITVFGEETDFDGVLEFSNRLVITGKFSGKINAPDGDLEISKNAVCEVESLNVNSLIISGNVKGKITAKERVEICSGSTVHSDISTARFRIANNVDYNGQVEMLKEEPDVDLFSVASSEFKKALLIHSDVVK
jgi:cytoskeletal protein CcmA (bactofilin family)